MLLISPSRRHHSITQQKMYLHWFTLMERKSFLSSVPRLPLSNKKSYCLMISSISDENCLLSKDHPGSHQTERWLAIFLFDILSTLSTHWLISLPSFSWNFVDQSISIIDVTDILGDLSTWRWYSSLYGICLRWFVGLQHGASSLK